MKLAKGHLADNITDEVDVLDFTAGALRFMPSFTIGSAVGPGPLRAVFGRAIKLMVSDEGYWIKTSDDQFYTPLVPGTPLTDDDIKYWKGCGVMLRIALLWNQNILPVSPLLLALLLGGLDAATDSSLLQCITPELAARLETWPPPLITCPNTGEMVYDVQLGRDPMNLIMQFIPNTQISRIRRLSQANSEALTMPLTTGLLFQTQEIKTDALHPIFEAMRDGLDDKGLTKWESTDDEDNSAVLIESTLIQTFQEAGVTIPLVVAGLTSSRRVMSYASLIPLLKSKCRIREYHFGFNPELHYEELVERWMGWLIRYLSGSGPPDHESFNSGDRENDALADSVLRPTLFLRAISGSEYLPDEDQPLTVNFVASLANDDLPDAVTPDVWFHTCSLTMDVPLNQHVAGLVDQVMPENHTSTTPFDLYIHALLLHSKEYNTL
ncbi:hypothetical protein OH77DRAFT_1593900 [Trametes cingulata]|nr:hypothetical protein OH77DRAFT_1593900 [Trametes cingulata]